MAENVREAVARRAKGRCEYCHLPEGCSILSFEIEHIVARKHGGRTVPENLAYACRYCNAYKGPNIAGMDPAGNEVAAPCSILGATAGGCTSGGTGPCSWV